MKATCFIWHAAPFRRASEHERPRHNVRAISLQPGQMNKYESTAAAAASAALQGLNHDKVKLENSPHLTCLLSKMRVDCCCHPRINVQTVARQPWHGVFIRHERRRRFCNSFVGNFLLEKRCCMIPESTPVVENELLIGVTALDLWWMYAEETCQRWIWRLRLKRKRFSIKWHTFYLYLTFSWATHEGESSVFWQ